MRGMNAGMLVTDTPSEYRDPPPSPATADGENSLLARNNKIVVHD